MVIENYYEENNSKRIQLSSLLKGGIIKEARVLSNEEYPFQSTKSSVVVDFGDAEAGPLVIVLEDGKRLILSGSEWACIQLFEEEHEK